MKAQRYNFALLILWLAVGLMDLAKELHSYSKYLAESEDILNSVQTFLEANHCLNVCCLKGSCKTKSVMYLLYSLKLFFKVLPGL